VKLNEFGFPELPTEWTTGPFGTEFELINMQTDTLLPIFGRMMEHDAERFFSMGRIEQGVTSLRYKRISEIILQDRLE
jgi:hypothetical protein